MTPREIALANFRACLDDSDVDARAPKSRAEIEQLVLLELQETGDCKGAKGICVTNLANRFPDGPNWTVAQYNAGTASDFACERALMHIVARFQGFYELVQKH